MISSLSPKLSTGCVAGAQRQEYMPAADNGLVRIVGVQMEPAANEDTRQNITGSGDALAGGATNRD